MTTNTIVTIVLIVITMAILTSVFYCYIRDKSLNEIRADVYLLFLEAEHNPEFISNGKHKMKWVLSQVRKLLPKWLQPIITDVFLEKIIECWFQAVKDLLDDGKLNKSVKEENISEQKRN